MKNSKIPVIHIAGTGRCGSTILDMVLGATPQLFSLGEFQNLYWEIKKPGRKCGCGEEITECPFWSGIIEEHRERINKGSIHYFRKNDSGNLLRWNLIRFIITKNQEFLDSEKISQYAEDNYSVLNTVLQKAQQVKREKISYLVDSSKDLYRLLWLQLSDKFNVKVIHLYKDPKAFVYSMIKRRGSFEKAKKTPRFTGRWIIENWLIKKVCANFFEEDDVLSLQYKDFAGSPDKAVSLIAKEFDFEYNSEAIESFREKSIHNISGNKAKLENKGVILDEKWEEVLPFYIKIFVDVFTKCQAEKYYNSSILQK